MRSIGGDHAIDYTREDFADGRRQFDVILDTAGNRPLARLRDALAVRGSLAIVGGEGGGLNEVPEAIRNLARGHARGKSVILVRED